MIFNIKQRLLRKVNCNLSENINIFFLLEIKGRNAFSKISTSIAILKYFQNRLKYINPPGLAYHSYGSPEDQDQETEQQSLPKYP